MKERLFEEVIVTCTGLTGILFDRFIDISRQDHPPEQLLYLAEGNTLVFPAINIQSFLYGRIRPGCVKRIEKKTESGDYIAVGSGATGIQPELPPFLRDGKPIIFKGFKNRYDKSAKIRVLDHKALAKETPVEKTRPFLELPWQLRFNLTLWENPLIDMNKMQGYFEQGGILVGFGTWRERFGKFTVEFEKV